MDNQNSFHRIFTYSKLKEMHEDIIIRMVKCLLKDGDDSDTYQLMRASKDSIEWLMKDYENTTIR